MKKATLGVAKVVVELTADGRIVATHSNGTLLYRGTATTKSWDKIVAGILRSCSDGTGPMTGH